MKDYYKILGVSPQADDREIKAAYRKLAKKYHPDVVGEDQEKRRIMYEIQEAYEIIGDAEKRREYHKKQTAAGQVQKKPAEPKWENPKGSHLSREEQFMRFFGFQPGKGMDTYQDRRQAKKPSGPLKPEEMFASFFKHM